MPGMDVKNAVNFALAYIQSFGPILPANNIRLEETEYNEKEGVWMITFSTSDTPLGSFRTYRQLDVDANTGGVRSMKVRPISTMPR